LSCSSSRRRTSFLRTGSHLLSKTPNAFIIHASPCVVEVQHCGRSCGGQWAQAWSRGRKAGSRLGEANTHLLSTFCRSVVSDGRVALLFPLWWCWSPSRSSCLASHCVTAPLRLLRISSEGSFYDRSLAHELYAQSVKSFPGRPASPT
jgi:hypothetical protein